MNIFSKINLSTFTTIVIICLCVSIRIGLEINDIIFLTDGLLPGLTITFLDILIVVLIYNQWDKSNKQEKLTILEKRLREYLIFFLKHNFKTLPKEYRVGRFYGIEHHKNVEYLDKLRAHVKDRGLTEEEMFTIQHHCEIEARTLSDLLPVASQLTEMIILRLCQE